MENEGLQRFHEREQRERSANAQPPVTHNMTQESRTRFRPFARGSTHLVGRGGVALVMFHLARLGLEFSETPANSCAGDLWVKTLSGNIIRIEVKTTTGRNLLIRSDQFGQANIYALVDLMFGRLWLLTTEELRDVIATSNQSPTASIYTISFKKIPKYFENGWQLLGVDWLPVSLFQKPEKKRPVRKSVRIIRHTLASGEVREYHYAPDKISHAKP